MRKAEPPGDLVTVDFAADVLQLHPKTVLRFIREGRLAANRIGKAYRIRRADLEALAGVALKPEPPQPAVWVTSIVDVPNVEPELAKRWGRNVMSALQARHPAATPIRAEVIHEPDRAHLKILITGSPGDTAALLSLIRLWSEQLTA